MIGLVVGGLESGIAQATNQTGQTNGGGTTGGQTTGGGTTGGQTNGGGTTGGQTTGGGTTGGQTTGGGTNGGQTTGADPTKVTPPAVTPVQPVPEPTGPMQPPSGLQRTLAPLNPFGFDYFAEARRVIDVRRGIAPAIPITGPIVPVTANGTNGSAQAGVAVATPTQAQTTHPATTPPATTPPPATTTTVTAPPAQPLQTAVGPDAMSKAGLSIPVPERYQLGPGDKLLVRFSSPTRALESVELTVDSRGAILLPVAGSRIVVRGMRLDEATRVLTREMRRYLRQATVDIQLQELRSITIRVLGEAYAPGSYEVPSVITVFNALYAAGGPNLTGSFRNIQLKRANGVTRRIDLYRLLVRGDSSQDVPMMAGDVLLIPPAEKRVSVRGEVRREAIYELLESESLRDAVRFAGGAKPSGVTQRVLIESVRPGIDRRLVDASLVGSAGAQTPPLYDGDTVEIFSIRPIFVNQITVEGAVDQPRPYAFERGMTVKDAVELARGVLPEATLERADLFRTNPDQSRKLIPIRLAEALKGDATQNIALQPLDRLVVYRLQDIQFIGTRRLTLRGAAARPGPYYRADGMTVRDLVIQAGGLQANANDRVAFLQRFTPDGQPGPLVRVDLGKALRGEGASNVVLQDEDILTINTVQEATFIPEQNIEISGSVQRPGTYTLAVEMRLADVVGLAGGPLPDASTEKVFVQRMNPNGTQGPLLVLNLQKALEGDAGQNIALQPKDRISIFSIREATFQVEEAVTISGAVQRPGTFRRSTNMTLRDLIDLSGGVLPNASDTVEITRAWAPIGTPVVRVKVMDAITDVPTANLELQSGDTVTLPARSDLLAKPRVVTVLGAVQFPGPYMLTGLNDRLSFLIQRAGGLTEKAFPEGAEFTRDPRYLSTEKQRSLRPQLAETLRLVNDDEYKRASALADLDRLRIVFGQGAAITSSGLSLAGTPQPSGPEIQPGVSLDQALAQALRSEAVTKARPLTERDLLPSGNLDISLDAALRRPGARQDIVLQDGDVIVVPERPTTVAVTGAVVLPSSVLFEEGKPLEYYLERAGGPTNDAALESIIIVRATGALLRYRRGIKVELGDNILVPTRVMAIRLRERRSDLETITQSVTSAGVTIALLRALTR
jgi:protein involved in polysaccharide export with SLBB domain